MQQFGFFDIDTCYKILDRNGDDLFRINAIVDWSGLAALMSEITFENEGGPGRPPLCRMMMAKVLILQAYHNLSDDTCEFMINDRLSFKRFLGLGIADKSPDAKAIWLWRERVRYAGLAPRIFAWFESELQKNGYHAEKGQIIDASFVPTHKPTGNHKKQMTEEIPLTPAQARQMDPDASFTKKNNTSYHGYKLHINIDKKHKLIRKETSSDAAPHDSRYIEEVLQEISPDAPEDDRNVWADSAYRAERIEAAIKNKNLISQIHEKGYRNHPLTEAQKKSNTVKSKSRCRVEHVFGIMENSMGGMMIHTIGLARAKFKITFKCLAYNLKMYTSMEWRKKQAKCA